MRRLLSFVPILILCSCAPGNSPFGEISNTHWEGTNVAKGILIDVSVASEKSGDIEMACYIDGRKYEERGAVIDTSGNLERIIVGKYKTDTVTTDAGSLATGYRWSFNGTDNEKKNHSGWMQYDNGRMYLNLDGAPYPMSQKK